MNKFINLVIKGVFVGVANVIPGVSGGTIAVVLRIFDEMIDAINNFFKDIKKHIAFLTPLLIGALIGIILFSKLIEFCLSKYSFQTNLFFVGLVVGSVPLIYKKASEKKVKSSYFAISFIAFAIVCAISLLKEPTDNNTANVINFYFLMKMFFGGIIASSAMVIPGISGSFVMVLLGMYNVVIGSVSGLIDVISANAANIPKIGIASAITNIIKSSYFVILLITGIGVVLGIIIISKLIALLLKYAFSFTYFSILGLIFGSVFAIFKDPVTYQSGVNTLSTIVGALTFVVGFFIAILLGKE